MAAAKTAEKPAAEEKPPADKVVVETVINEPIPGEGITGFSVTAGVAEDFGKHKTSTTLHYGFGRAVGVIDIATVHTEMREVVSELEVDHHRQHLARALAEFHADTQQVQAQPAAPPVQPPVPPAAPAQAPAPEPGGQQGGVPWVHGTKPNGGGAIRYVPSSLFPTESFQQVVGQVLAAQGLNPAGFEVWDNRVGQYGLESGNSAYSVGAVKPASHNPLAQMVGQTSGGNPKATHYVEFNDDGSLAVKPSKEYEAACAAPAAAPPQQAGWQPPPVQ